MPKLYCAKADGHLFIRVGNPYGGPPITYQVRPDAISVITSKHPGLRPGDQKEIERDFFTSLKSQGWYIPTSPDTQRPNPGS